jgi:hypothetical protein
MTEAIIYCNARFNGSSVSTRNEILDKCRKKERDDAAFTIKRWKRSI